MARLQWNVASTPAYENGVDRGVLYVSGQDGVAWNGLVSVSESPSGGEPRAFYIDGEKYLNVSSLEEFNGTIEAYYSPPEFDECDGTKWLDQKVHVGQQERKAFGFSFRSRTELGHKLHLIYNALAAPTDRVYSTITDSPTAPSLAWAITTRSVPVQGMRHTGHIEIDRDKADPTALAELEDILYGTATTPPRFPSANEVLAIFDANVHLIVINHGDGSFTVIGPDEFVQNLGNGRFRLRTAAVEALVGGAYVITYTPTRRRA